MTKKEFTKKQLKKQLGNLNEASTLKLDMKKSFDALKKLDHVTTGQKIGDLTITKAMNKKIKNAKRYIEDLWDKITDGEIEEKETHEGKEVEERNSQSEGHGKMYNALKNVKEEKVIKINESTLKRIVERVIKEQSDVSFDDMLSKLSEAVTRIKKVSTTAWIKSDKSTGLTDKELADGKKIAYAELKSILDSYTK